MFFSKLLTKSKGQLSNVHCQWTYRYLLLSAFWVQRPCNCYLHYCVLSPMTLYMILIRTFLLPIFFTDSNGFLLQMVLLYRNFWYVLTWPKKWVYLPHQKKGTFCLPPLYFPILLWLFMKPTCISFLLNTYVLHRTYIVLYRVSHSEECKVNQLWGVETKIQQTKIAVTKI